MNSTPQHTIWLIQPEGSSKSWSGGLYGTFTDEVCKTYSSAAQCRQLWKNVMQAEITAMNHHRARVAAGKEYAPPPPFTPHPKVNFVEYTLTPTSTKPIRL